MTAAPAARARRAEALAACLPPLLVAAERVAATVAQGVHGRRKVGQGESFWQFRPFQHGDSVARIDWRQSAKSARIFVRESEWEAAQTVLLWRDASPSMAWRPEPGQESKQARAELLLLALAALVLRGGERVRLLGAAPHPASGRVALEALAETLAAAPPTAALPEPAGLPRHARLVAFGDFLAPPEETAAAIAALAAAPVAGQIVMVLDPAERAFPYQGRLRFAGPEGEGETLIARAEAVRGAYAERLAAQIGAVEQAARAVGWGFALHDRGQPPEAALLALYMGLDRGLYRGRVAGPARR